MNRFTLLSGALLLLAPAALAQQARDQVRIDDPAAANTPDGFDIFVDGEGDLRVAMWVDERDTTNTFDDDIWIAISQDNGLTWGQEIQVTNGAFSAIDIDDAYLEVAGGTIYVSYDDDALGSTTPQAVVTYSSDLGATWSTVVLDVDGQNPRVAAQGNDVVVVWYNDLSTPNPLKAVTSTTGAAGLASATAVQINGAGDIDADGYDLVVDNGMAHVAYVDDSVVAVVDDIYLTSYDFAAGTWSAPLQLNDTVASPGGNVDIYVRMDVDGGKVHVAWNEDDLDPAFTTDDVVFYRNYDIATGTLSAEVQLSQAPPVDTDYMWMDADGSTVAVTWTDDQTGTDQLTRVRVSNDGGATFGPEIAIPSFGGGGPENGQQMRVFVDGSMIFLVYEDDSLNTGSADEVPAFAYSSDFGASFEGPFLLGSNFEADEDIDTEGTAWYYSNQSLTGFWQTDGGAANPDGAWAAGIRFPFIGFEQDLLNGTFTLSLAGVDRTLGSGVARWTASDVLGTLPHPENPALTLDLGASQVYNFVSTRLNALTGRFTANGTAVKTLPTPANAVGRSLYLQGWVNSNGVGGRASDVLAVTIQ